MKRTKRTAVILMCLAALLSLFGCKDRFKVDGPDMENTQAWERVSLSRSDAYAQHTLEEIEERVLESKGRLDEVAECIRCDLMVRKEGVLQWNIPVFTAEELRQLTAEMQQPAAELADLLQPAVDAIYQRLLCETPAHLHDQIRGMFGLEFNAIISMFCELLLPKPQASPFAGQVVLLTGDAPALRF